MTTVISRASAIEATREVALADRTSDPRELDAHPRIGVRRLAVDRPLIKESVLAKVRSMAKVTSKLQVTVPKALADRFGIVPGDEIEWEPAGDVIRVVPPRRAPASDLAARRRLFDKATERQREREAGRPAEAASERGWTREELYERSPSR